MKALESKEHSAKELLVTLGYTSKMGSFKKAMQNLLNLGKIEMTHPDSPNSKMQAYKLKK